MYGKLGHQPFTIFKKAPGLLKLQWIVRIVEQLQRKSPHNAVRCIFRKSAVLRQ